MFLDGRGHRVVEPGRRPRVPLRPGIDRDPVEVERPDRQGDRTIAGEADDLALPLGQDPPIVGRRAGVEALVDQLQADGDLVGA